MRSHLVLSLLFAATAMTVLSAIAQERPPAADDAFRLQLDEARELLRAQAAAIEQLRRQVESQGRQIDALRAQTPAPAMLGAQAGEDAARLRNAVMAMAMPALRPAVMQATKPENKPAAAAPDQPAPLFLRIGSATFTPGGFIDFTTYFRTTNMGSGIGTNFAAIPYNNTVQGGLSELRLSAQSTRFTLKVDEKIGALKAMAYAELDFNGNQAGNLFVNKNSNTMRMRVAYASLDSARWELIGGQYWALLTPTRRALSPTVADLFTTNHIDSNYQTGLPYARQPGMRVVYRPSKPVALGLSVENAEQYTGSAVVFPALFSNVQTDINSSTGSGGANTTPNAAPDVMAKATFDHKIRGLDWHAGLGGLLTSIKIVTPASVTKAAVAKDTRTGGAVVANVYGQLSKSVNLIGVAFWSDGGGRYLNGDGPAFVVLQKSAATAPFQVALIHSGSALTGFEWKAARRMTISGTASGTYFERRYAVDPSVKTSTSYNGYGYPGAPNSQNRSIYEYSLATNNVLWQSQTAGSLVLVTQGSYLVRNPWVLATGAPKNAHLYMQYASLRYVIP